MMPRAAGPIGGVEGARRARGGERLRRRMLLLATDRIGRKHGDATSGQRRLVAGAFPSVDAPGGWRPGAFPSVDLALLSGRSIRFVSIFTLY